MSQHRQQFHMGGGGGGGGHNGGGHFGDTTFTKIFVGGLAWETQRETMRRYFEQFGEIQEAVVITDKNTGRSKGYGFVTFKDPESATRACHDPSPVIDGRRANCNLASLGAQRSTRPTTPHQHGRYRAVSGGPPVLPPAAYHHHQGQGGSSSAYFHQPAQYALPYSTYGYSGYSQENMYPMSYYSVYGGQHYSPYYATPPPAPAAAAAPSTPHSGGGIYPNFIPYYPQYAQPSQTQGFGIQYPQLIQYPYLPHHYTTAATAVLSLPASVPSVVPSATSSTNGTGTSQTAVATKTTTEQTSSST